MLACALLTGLLALSHQSAFSAVPVEFPATGEIEDRIAPEDLPVSAITSPDWSEPGLLSPVDAGAPATVSAAGVFGPAARQPAGALSGRIVFMNSGHGWTYDPSYWRLQRPSPLQEMNEDYGNLDQLNFFASYCFNAGAVVVSMRPLGHQTNEVVLDNDDAGVVFSGAWSDSTSPLFFGSPGDVPYRFTTLSAAETATATYTPAIPVEGYYPVYTWVRHGSDRGDQLYRIRHTGGESQVRIPHYMVGNGWIYLGEYYFSAGSNPASGSVVISNLRQTAPGDAIIADAIRFGNGMGSVNRGGGVSGYPREDESMRYWIQGNLAQGQSSSLYDGSGNDESDSWSAPPKMSAEMNREASGDLHQRIHISFHSNAGGARGTVGLITGDPTPHQSNLAQIAGAEVNNDLVALGSPPLELPWYNRTSVTYSGGYSEIDGSLFNYEMAATIIEVAYHDSAEDAKLMRDPKARAAVGKAAMHAVIKYMNQFDTNNPVPLTFLPEPPTNVRAIAGQGGDIALSWAAPVSLGGSQPPTNYVVYRSTDGHGFGNPVFVGNVTSHTVTGLPPDVDYYFRVAGSNAGGESMPSEVVGCRAPATNSGPRVLVVNGYDRFDRTTNLRQDTQGQSYDPPGATGGIERVFPRWNNAFDYVVQHGKALAQAGARFDSCQNEAVANLQVALANYDIVLWACGNESVSDETFSSIEQTRLEPFVNGGGHLFVSGSDIAWDLDRAAGPTPSDRIFLNNVLHVDLGSDANDNSGSYAFTSAAGAIFSGNAGASFDDGNAGIYRVATPDKLTPVGAGASPALNYASGSGGVAAVQCVGSSGAGNVVVLGFPFETITSAAARQAIMEDLLGFFTTPTTNPPTFSAQPQDQVVLAGDTAEFSAFASGAPPIGYQWQLGGVDIPGATAATLTLTNVDQADAGGYRVIATNALGSATSDFAGLFIALPPTNYVTAFADDFDVNTASDWVTNRSTTDTRVTFHYNYDGDGIGLAPATTNNTKLGVKFEANLAGGLPAAINISPIGQSFVGDYRMRFNMWLNANGPFPGGGVGSTEHFTAGVGTAGDRVQWTGAGTADGVWFAVDGEGGSSDTTTTSLPDIAALNGATLQAANSGVYSAGTASNSRGNGNTYYHSTFPGGQTAPSSQTTTYPQQTGSLPAGSVGFGWRSVLIEKSGDTVEWFIDGLKIASFQGLDPAGNVFLGYWDSYNSVSDNPALSFGLADNLVVEVPVTNYAPVIVSHPGSQVVEPGSSTGFTVEAGAAPAPSYQWQFNGANISGATSNFLAYADVQPTDAGDYTVVVSNAFGVVTSAVAKLTVVQPVQLLSVGVADGQFQMALAAQPGAQYSIESSTNLLDWEVLETFIATNSPVLWSDADSTNHPLRFYRSGASAP